MIDLEIQVKGVEEALQSEVFRALEPARQSEVLSVGLKAGAKVIQRFAKAYAPVRQNVPGKGGDLRAGIIVKARKLRPTPQGGRARAVCMVGEGFYQGDTYYAGFQEWGWHFGKRTAANKRFQKKRGLKWALGLSGGSSIDRDDERPYIEPKTAHYMERAANSSGVESAVKEAMLKELGR